MIETVTYDEAIADLDAGLAHAYEEALGLVVAHGASETQIHSAMRKVSAALADARAKGVATLDMVYARVETLH